MTIDTLADVFSAHANKFNNPSDETVVNVHAAQDTFFEPFIGETANTILKSCVCTMTDVEKKLVVLVLRDQLTRLCDTYVKVIDPGTPAFQIMTPTLMAQVVGPAFRYANRHSDPFEVSNNNFIWCLWACVQLLHEAGWQVIEQPPKFEQTENGVVFDVTAFEHIILSAQPVST